MAHYVGIPGTPPAHLAGHGQGTLSGPSLRPSPQQGRSQQELCV